MSLTGVLREIVSALVTPAYGTLVQSPQKGFGGSLCSLSIVSGQWCRVGRRACAEAGALYLCGVGRARLAGCGSARPRVRAGERLQRNSVKKHKTVSVTGRTSIDLVSQSTLYIKKGGL